MLNRVMTKDNIGLAALLETKEAAWSNGNSLNLKWNPQDYLYICITFS